MFRDRTEAGKHLAKRIAALALEDPVVFALPRGGVPVAIEVARRLSAPLDLLLVRKLGMPGQAELAAGAVVEGGGAVFNDAILAHVGLGRSAFDDAIAEKEAEIAARRKLWLEGEPQRNVAGRTAVVVDDGIATGATMKAALKGLKLRKPARIVVALPVGPRDVVEELRSMADEVICMDCPEPFYAVGAHYSSFDQIRNEEVTRLLRGYRRERKDSA